MDKTPHILVINDDSVEASGIHHLVDFVKDFARVTVVAPDRPRSATGHAITVMESLRYEKMHWDGADAYKCSGTPADCVKMALNVILKDDKPDLCLSGINHGPNHTVAVFYSGTMAAAIEAGFYDIPAIGFSFVDEDQEADFSQLKLFVIRIIKNVLSLDRKEYPHLILNVNIPVHTEKKPICGIRLVRQGYGKFIDVFDKVKISNTKTHFLPKGYFENFESHCSDTDFNALENRYISIVPVALDLTHYGHYKRLSKIWQQ